MLLEKLTDISYYNLKISSLIKEEYESNFTINSNNTITITLEYAENITLSELPLLTISFLNLEKLELENNYKYYLSP